MNESLTMHTFLGLTAALGPRIIISPHIAIFASEIIKLFPFPSSVSISSESTLICRHKQKVESNAEADSRSFFGGHPCKWVERKCPLIIQQLDLDGTLDIEVDLHSNVANQLIIGEEISPCTSKSHSKHVSIHNRGHCLVSTVESTPDSPLSVEVIAMRGYIFKLVESTKVVIPPTDAHTNTTDASVDANLSDESIPIAIDTCSGSARQNIYRWDGDHVVLQEHY